MSSNQLFQSRSGLSLMLSVVVVLITLITIAGIQTSAEEPANNPNRASTSNTPQSGLPEMDVAIGKQIYRVEVASTPEQMQKGLMFRQKLPTRHGMLFLFQPARVVQFWMKNTYIPLDMLFLSQGRVAYIAKNVRPCRSTLCPSYGPDTHTDMVIELPAGTAKKDRIMPGDVARVVVSQSHASPTSAEIQHLEAASFQCER